MTMVSNDVERELLLDALDEDAVLSAVEGVARNFRLELAEAFECVRDLLERELVELYRYGDLDKNGIIPVLPSELKKEIRERPYEVFLAHTEKTFGRLAEVQDPNVS